MEVATWDISLLLADDTQLTEEQFKQLVSEVHQGEYKHLQFAQYLHEAVEKNKAQLQENAAMAIKAAQGFFALGEYEQALEWLEKSGESKIVYYLKGLTLRELKRYDEAILNFEKAEEKGYDSFDIGCKTVDCLRMAGKLEEAAERLKRISRVGDIRAEYHYQLGRLHDANGQHEQAVNEFEQALKLDENHVDALFHLAYILDLYGEEDLAIEYYQRCVESGHAPVSALLNQAVLYEDCEEYRSALKCVKSVLASFPNHPRANMFKKDLEASLTMYYDEDQERRQDRRNKVLEIPISDFELSVRSRNCLKKMNIRTLGDLLKVTESELLAYKNFGETSLQEIKNILLSKGLRLGQMLEENKNSVKNVKEDTKSAGVDEAILKKPVSQLEISVRSRKCLERLNVNTLGDLAYCTEAELLGCKNFGMTSLQEITKALQEHGLSLRKMDE